MVTKNRFLKYWVLPAVALTISMQGFSQNRTSLSGTVTDKSTQVTIAGVTVTLMPPLISASTDSVGNFRLGNLLPGTYAIQITGVGYQVKMVTNIVLTTGNETSLQIELEPSVTQLDSLVVTGRRNSVRATTLESPLSVQRLTTEDIKANPGGNFDISRVIQSLPGVGGGVTGGSYRNDIIIRGGSPAENVFYLDGIEVPVINHFSTQGSGGGPQGILNVSFIEDVKLSTSAFDARYDNALSSVFQFRQKNGNNKRIQGNIRLSGTELAATFDGPVSAKTTFLASARRSYLQFLFQALDLPIRPNYWDFQFKSNTRIDNKTSLTFIGIGAIDEFSFAAPKDATAEKLYVINSNPIINQWTYTVGGILKRLIKDGFWTLALSRNTLQNDVDKFLDNDFPDEQTRTLRINSNEAENKLRFDLTKNYRSWKLAWGAVAQLVNFSNEFYQVFRPEVKDAQGNVIQPPVTLASTNGTDFMKYGAFIQAGRRMMNDRIALSVGLRTDINTSGNSSSNPLDQLSTRISVSYALGQKWNASASYGIYYRLPSYTQLAYTTSTGQQNPGRYIRSTHYVGGVEFLPGSATRFTVEGFYKKYHNYPTSITEKISLANKGTEFGAIGNEPVQQNGEGKAYGWEFFAQQKLTKRIFGVMSYTWYRSEFTGTNGTFSPSSWDNRHLLSLTMGYKFNRNWELGLKFRYQGEPPYTPYDLDASRLNYLTVGTGIFNYNQVNTLRLPAYHSADIRVDKRWNFRKVSLEVFLDVQNFYAAKNSGVPQYTFQRKLNNSDFETTDGQPVKMNGSNAIPLLLDNRDGTLLPTIGFVVAF